MPYRFYIDTSLNCVFLQHYDSYEKGEGPRANEDFTSDKKYQKSMNILRDFSLVSLPEDFESDPKVKASENRMKAEGENMFGACQIAFVMSSAVDFRIIHRFTVSTRLNGRIDRMPFREISHARDWLGIPDDYEIKYPN
jgi:hypothetical protein